MTRLGFVGALALAAGLAGGFALARTEPAAPPDPARAELAGVCHRAARAFAAGDAVSVLHTVLGMACIPPGDRAARNAAADAWSRALDRCVAARVCAELATLTEQYAALLSPGR